MSIVGNAIARAEAAATRAGQLAPLVHCDLAKRDAIRGRLAQDGTGAADALAAELEARWRGLDAGKYGRLA